MATARPVGLAVRQQLPKHRLERHYRSSAKRKENVKLKISYSISMYKKILGNEVNVFIPFYFVLNSDI
jgi:hypothetical protein